MWPAHKINEAARNPGPVLLQSDVDDRIPLEHHINTLSSDYGSMQKTHTGHRVSHSSNQMEKKYTNILKSNTVKMHNHTNFQKRANWHHFKQSNSNDIDHQQLNYSVWTTVSENSSTQNMSSILSKIQKKVAKQKERSCDKIQITFSSSQLQSDYYKEFIELIKSDPLNEFGSSFFQRLNQLIAQKPIESIKTVIKLNCEPVFPLKTTIDYLCLIYEGTSVKIHKINKKKSNNSQFSIDIFIPKV